MQLAPESYILGTQCMWSNQGPPLASYSCNGHLRNKLLGCQFKHQVHKQQKCGTQITHWIAITNVLISQFILQAPGGKTIGIQRLCCAGLCCALLNACAQDAEKKAKVILKGLGLDDEMAAKPTNSLSGGWRMRVAWVNGFLFRMTRYTFASLGRMIFEMLTLQHTRRQNRDVSAFSSEMRALNEQAHMTLCLA